MSFCSTSRFLPQHQATSVSVSTLRLCTAPGGTDTVGCCPNGFTLGWAQPSSRSRLCKPSCRCRGGSGLSRCPLPSPHEGTWQSHILVLTLTKEGRVILAPDAGGTLQCAQQAPATQDDPAPQRTSVPGGRPLALRLEGWVRGQPLLSSPSCHRPLLRDRGVWPRGHQEA